MTEAQKEEKQPNPKINLVFVGACILTNNKKGGAFLQVTPEQWKAGNLPKDLPERIFDWKVAGQCGRPGTVWEFEVPADNPDKSIFPGTRRFIGRCEDEHVVQWQAKHDALLTDLELQAKEKREKGRNYLLEEAEPLRLAYRKLIGRQRTIFLAQIIGYITGKSKE